jgi:hypothetical protein
MAVGSSYCWGDNLRRRAISQQTLSALVSSGTVNNGVMLHSLTDFGKCSPKIRKVTYPQFKVLFVARRMAILYEYTTPE